MKIQMIDGTKVEMTYEELCKRLGFSAKVHFVKVHDCGTITFTIGKSQEIHALYSACIDAGIKPSKKLRIA